MGLNDQQRIENLVIIGSGPAGLTAAIYAGRANLKPVMFEGFQVGGLPGGQLMTTTEVENFPGFPEGMTGPALMERMRRQAQRWGTELYTEDVTQVDLQQRPFRVQSDDRVVSAHSVIIATGAVAKRLHLPSESQYWNRGISACAVCDGAMPIFRQVELVVIGGGDTACEEATYLSKFGSHVHLLVRRDVMRASKAMQDRVFHNPKITVHWHTEAVDVIGNGQRLTGVQIKQNQTGEVSEIPAGGFFYAIGHTPNTELFRGQLDLDAAGYIMTQPPSMATNIEGVFAAGDVQDHDFRQAVTAAGSGCMAALLAERWLSAQGLAQEFSAPDLIETSDLVDSELAQIDNGSNEVGFGVAEVDFGIDEVDFDVPEAEFSDAGAGSGVVEVDFSIDEIDFNISEVDFSPEEPDHAPIEPDDAIPAADEPIPEANIEVPDADLRIPVVEFSPPDAEAGVIEVDVRELDHPKHGAEADGSEGQPVAYDQKAVLSSVTMSDPAATPQDPSIHTLREALAFFLEQDNYIDRLEAEGLKNLILQDGQVTPEEHQFLEDAIRTNNFDSEALKILKDLLSRHQVIKPDISI